MKGSDYLSYEGLLYQIFFDEFLVELIQTNAKNLNSGNYGADIAKTIVVYCKSGFQDEICFKDKDNASAFWKSILNLFVSIIPIFVLSMSVGMGLENGNPEAPETFKFFELGMYIFVGLMFVIFLCSHSYYSNKHSKRNLIECSNALYYYCANTIVTKEDYEYLANQNIYFKKICINAGILEEKKELQ